MTVKNFIAVKILKRFKAGYFLSFLNMDIKKLIYYQYVITIRTTNCLYQMMGFGVV